MQGVQAALEMHLRPVAVVCLSVGPAAEEGEGAEEESWSESTLDFLLLRRDVYLSELETAKAQVREARPLQRPPQFHTLLVDVSASNTVPTKLDAATAAASLGELLRCLPRAEQLSDEPYQLLELVDAVSFHASCGLCFLVGWVLGYPCVYQNGSARRGSAAGLSSNCLSMQTLRQSRLVVPVDAFLAYVLGGEGRAGQGQKRGNTKGAERECPSGVFLKGAQEVTVFELTAPARILGGGDEACYSRALEHQAELVRELLGQAELASVDVQLPAVMM